LLSCIFCDIISGKRDGHFIYEDSDHVAFLDKYPIDKGHSLVVPKKHHEKLTDMNPQSVGNLFSQIPKIVQAVMAATNADAFSLAQNNGRAAKQIIPHVHVHIIPRYNDAGPIWTKRTIPSCDELETLAQKIRQHVKN
jgi:histidine triad (HIT) family protein